jgi:hypothetical protein
MIKDIEYCIEECQPGSSIALASVAAFFWLVSCFSTLSCSLQEAEGVHPQKDCVKHHGNSSLELDASMKRPLLS